MAFGEPDRCGGHTSVVCRRTYQCAETHHRRVWRGSRRAQWLLGQAEALEACVELEARQTQRGGGA